MAVRQPHLKRCSQPQVVDVIGSQATDGSGVPTGSVTGYGTLSRTGAGTYRVTLDIPTPSIIFPQVVLLKSAAADFYPQIVSVDATNKRFDFRTLTGSTETDFASGTIYWCVAVKSTAVTG